ncbi:hypothetical protein [Aequorivita lipolytica]|uniref:DUF1735 domain-containing protein n=1 Tax=Aequorivita lipolytica TaxID=153267 RepID=A0A5C6YVE3_9FLAO|nr:hypothetical protein [Aequorivita lipolytica]TXD70893.1 hypothetical protein ESV24_02045 [Aequorivita lipolytica]SRX49947.1 hypothetical protein AEQU2_00413 [Aequorivita lipolytica]
MNKTLYQSIFLVCVCLFFTACIKDTDFDQTEDIALTPVVELDLIYFNLRASDFFDSINSTPILTVSDTTEIRFLDDSTLQESLKRAEFYFKFTNSIPRNFQVDFQFLSETNDTTYVAGTFVSEGLPAAPVITEYIQNVEGDDILSLTQANKVVVSVTIPSSNENLEGTLNLKSKTTYFLEY